jgi:hypothetical protein
VEGLITDVNETAYREEVRDLAVGCQDNNISKTKELIMDYSKRTAERVHITKDLSWLKTHQYSCEEGTTMPLPTPKAESIWHGPQILKKFYSCTI